MTNHNGDHSAKAAVLRCMDYRFVSSLRDHLIELGLKGQYDLISVAGSAKCLVDPANPNDPEFIMRQIEISERLHHITMVILVNHLDCGAYGGIHFASPKEERARHEADLAKAKEMIQAQFPELEVKTVLAGLVSATSVQVEHLEPSAL